MKYRLTGGILLLIGFNTLASDTFEGRKAQALQVERTQAGRNYLARLLPAVHSKMEKIMTACVPDGEKGTIVRFELVAKIAQDGTISNVDVLPKNSKSICYAEKFAKIKAPAPPTEFSARGFPIAIERINELQ